MCAVFGAFVWSFGGSAEFQEFVRVFELIYYVAFVVTVIFLYKTYTKQVEANRLQTVSNDKLLESMELQAKSYKFNALTEIFRFLQEHKTRKARATVYDLRRAQIPYETWKKDPDKVEDVQKVCSTFAQAGYLAENADKFEKEPSLFDDLVEIYRDNILDMYKFSVRHIMYRKIQYKGRDQFPHFTKLYKAARKPPTDKTAVV